MSRATRRAAVTPRAQGRRYRIDPGWPGVAISIVGELGEPGRERSAQRGGMARAANRRLR